MSLALRIRPSMADKFIESEAAGLEWLREENCPDFPQSLEAFRFWVECGKENALPDDLMTLSANRLDQLLSIHRAEKVAVVISDDRHTGRVLSITLSSDGRRVASCSADYTLKIWDSKSGRCIASLKGHTDYVQSAAFSPNGKYLASASDDKTVRLWDATSTDEGKCLAVLEGHTNYVMTVAFSNDGLRLASGSHDKTVRLWDVEAKQCVTVLKGCTHDIRSVIFSPDGLFIAATSYGDSVLRLWDTSTESVVTFEGHTDTAYCAAFSPDGEHFASGADDGTVKLWDKFTGDCLATLKERDTTKHVTSLTFPSNDEIVAVVSWGLSVWSASTHKPIAYGVSEDTPSLAMLVDFSVSDEWLIAPQVPGSGSWKTVYYLPKDYKPSMSHPVCRDRKAIYGTHTGNIVILDWTHFFD
jgi:WD40 repeat protein